MVAKGGFSSKVWKSKFLQNYIKDQKPLFGYVGHSYRNKTRDKIVEEELRALCLSDESIGAFIALRAGRHLGDALSMVETPSQIREEVRRFVKGWPITRDLKDVGELKLLRRCQVRVPR